MQLTLLPIPLLLLTTLLLWSSCSPSSTVESTAEEFMWHIVQEDFEAAKALASPQTKAILDIIVANGKINKINKDADQMYEEAIKKSATTSVEVDCTCEQNKKVAKCNCCNKKGKDLCLDLILNQEEKEWVVHLPKNQNPQ